ncbi:MULTISPECIES: DUF484 family protein [unclassified Thioalkalivibrio]|uniref:DUF484 family protein n=1 Tax=unclassified Thioalkalivibrio TaxID=2621013 RepID=UPI0003668F72|nr:MULTISPECIES: DUF484 family protein [unclassified Thioalkalivibrio]
MTGQSSNASATTKTPKPQATDDKNNKTLTAADVEAYLRDHPDFFQDHLPLLDILRLPHPAGGAVSLMERQVALLREKHRAMEQHMGELVERARDNERMGQHLHELAKTLMRAENLDAVLALTQDALRNELGAERVSIRLADREVDDLHALESGELSTFDPLFARGKAQCGRVPGEMLDVLFDSADGIGSAILMPLGDESDRIGVLGLASDSPDRFQPDMGIYFVTHIGDLLAESIRCHVERTHAAA